jgi:hypothetical protein
MGDRVKRRLQMMRLPVEFSAGVTIVKQTNKLRGLSPPLNYTDRASAVVGEVSGKISG